MCQTFSLDYVMGLVDDREMVIDLMQTFLDETPEDYQKLCQYAKAEDFINCRILSHKLKSSLGIFKVEPLRTHFETIEHLCREEKSMSNIQQMIFESESQFEIIYQILRQELQK